MKNKLDLSKAFDHKDPEQGQKIFEKIMTPELRHHLSKHVSDHLMSKQGSEAWRSSPNAAGGAQGASGEDTGLP